MGSNNITAGMTEWNDRKWLQNCRNEQKGKLKEEKLTIKQSLAPKRSGP